jgi:ubiquinone/menaquinone biosynthesis C-methylase UbiE
VLETVYIAALFTVRKQNVRLLGLSCGFYGHNVVVGVATHLGIDLTEYDARIRTFIPYYEEMLDVAVAAVPEGARTIVDLGTGTGALAARCLDRAGRARIIGVDADAEILKLAERRLGDRASLVCRSFLRAPLPASDAIMASFALHHVRTRDAKARLYRRIRVALGSRGVFVTVDCHPSRDRALAKQQRSAWRSHLLESYTGSRATAFLRAWSDEDVYMPLTSEIALQQRAGFSVDVLWRKGSFAVLRGV